MGSSEEIRFGEEKLQRVEINTMRKKSVGNVSFGRSVEELKDWLKGVGEVERQADLPWRVILR